LGVVFQTVVTTEEEVRKGKKKGLKKEKRGRGRKIKTWARATGFLFKKGEKGVAGGGRSGGTGGRLGKGGGRGGEEKIKTTEVRGERRMRKGGQKRKGGSQKQWEEKKGDYRKREFCLGHKGIGGGGSP